MPDCVCSFSEDDNITKDKKLIKWTYSQPHLSDVSDIKKSQVLEKNLTLDSFQEELTCADVETLYRKNNKLKKDSVKAIIEWVHNQPHLPEINEIQAIIFLQRWQYQAEVAKNALDSYFTYKTKNADLFLRRNPHISPLREALDVCLLSVLSKKTPKGYSILFGKFLDFDVDKFDFGEQVKHADMVTLLSLYHEGPSNGFLLVFDLKDISSEIKSKFSLYVMRRFYDYFLNIGPMQIKGVHCFNTLPFIREVFQLGRGFLSREIASVLSLHADVKELTKFVPIECLPEDYGGSAGSIQILNEITKNNLFANASLFAWEDKQVVDEEKRPEMKDELMKTPAPTNFFCSLI